MKAKGLFFSVIILSVISFSSCTSKARWIKNQGRIFGTTYHITYKSPDGKDLHNEVLLALDSVNKSLSTYDSTSVISLFNRSDVGTKTDAHFQKVLRTASRISEATTGAFDMTVAPAVNAWGFGFTNKMEMTPEVIDSLKQLIGMQYIELTGDSIVKLRSGIMLDASAIAKGYGVDVAAKTLSQHGCKNYLVEIGGEVTDRGNNPKGNKWRIGIDKPIDDPTASNRKLQLVIELSGKALATSGNYRQFYMDEKTGKKYAHTIDPKTCMPVNHSLLSASIVAPDCMTADAYATACMVMGLDKSMHIVSSHSELEGCFIYNTKDGMKVIWTEGFKQYVAEQ
jgi:thiamine biosynthesis lipoprotein